MARVNKLRGYVNASTIPEKAVMLGAIDKCLAHPAHRASATAIEPVLAFGKRRASVAAKLSEATEVEFRLYARMAIALIGYISFPAQLEAAKDLKAQLNDSKYGDVGFAKAQFNKYKGIANAVQGIAPAAIVDIEQFKGGTHLGEDNVSDRINKAVSVGIDSIRESIKKIEANDKQCQELVLRWFGDGATAKLLANFKKMLARATDPMNPIFIQYEVKDVWGTSHANSRSINLGKKFFSDEFTLPTSKLGSEYIANDEQVQNVKQVTAANSLLKARQFTFGLLENELKYANGSDKFADAIASCAADGKEHNKNELAHLSLEQYTRQLTEHALWFDLNPDDTVNVTKGKLAAARAKAQREKDRLIASQGDLSLMEVTAFGAFVHELTHMVLGTQDLDAKCIDAPGQQVYGPLLCQMVASKDANLALNNADNYRHFVECWVS